MSKRSLFWGQGSGKLGEAVYYRAGGEQRTRAYTKTVKNPKTLSQATQRCKFNNMVGAFRAMKIAVQSFMNEKNANQSAFNSFFRINWPLNAWVGDKSSIGFNEGVMNGFYVARGKCGINTSLTQQSWKTESPNDTVGLVMEINPANVPLPQGYIDSPDLYTGDMLFNLFRGENNPYALPDNFDVTVIIASQGNEAQGCQIFTINCSAGSKNTWRCLAFPVNSSAPSVAYMKALITWVDGKYTDPSGGTGSVEGVTKICIGGSVGDESELQIGAALVISYKDTSGKQCTNSRVTYSTTLAKSAGDYTPGAEAGQQIIAQYTQASDLIL